MAKRYGILPSQALKLGNSIDVKCAINALYYENYLNTKANGKVTPQHSASDLQAMMDAVRNKK